MNLAASGAAFLASLFSVAEMAAGRGSPLISAKRRIAVRAAHPPGSEKTSRRLPDLARA